MNKGLEEVKNLRLFLKVNGQLSGWLNEKLDIIEAELKRLEELEKQNVNYKADLLRRM